MRRTVVCDDCGRLTPAGRVHVFHMPNGEVRHACLACGKSYLKCLDCRQWFKVETNEIPAERLLWLCDECKKEREDTTC